MSDQIKATADDIYAKGLTASQVEEKLTRLMQSPGGLIARSPKR